MDHFLWFKRIQTIKHHDLDSCSIVPWFFVGWDWPWQHMPFFWMTVGLLDWSMIIIVRPMFTPKNMGHMGHESAGSWGYSNQKWDHTSKNTLVTIITDKTKKTSFMGLPYKLISEREPVQETLNWEEKNVPRSSSDIATCCSEWWKLLMLWVCQKKIIWQWSTGNTCGFSMIVDSHLITPAVRPRAQRSVNHQFQAPRIHKKRKDLIPAPWWSMRTTKYFTDLKQLGTRLVFP